MVDVPKIFTFSSGVAETTKVAILDQYAQLHPALRRGFESYNGTNVTITVVPDSFKNTKRESSFLWAGYHGNPTVQTSPFVNVPVALRTLKNYGKSNIVIAERSYGFGEKPTSTFAAFITKLGDFFGLKSAEIILRRAAIHESGHQIDSAVVNNYANGSRALDPLLVGWDRLTNDQQLVDAYKKDLQVAGIIGTDGRYLPEKKGEPFIFRYILPNPESDGSISPQEWARATAEGFAEVFANRYSNTFDAIRKQYPDEASDFTVFKNFTLFVAAAANHFAGEDVPPVNKIPGEGPTPVLADLYAPGSFVNNNTPHSAVPPEKFRTEPIVIPHHKRDRRDIKGVLCVVSDPSKPESATSAAACQQTRHDSFQPIQ